MKGDEVIKLLEISSYGDLLANGFWYNHICILKSRL